MNSTAMCSGHKNIIIVGLPLNDKQENVIMNKIDYLLNNNKGVKAKKRCFDDMIVALDPKITLIEKKSSIETGSTKKTKNTNSSNCYTTITSNDSKVILSITEGRGNALREIGLATMDAHRPNLIISQFSDNFRYTGTIQKIELYQPILILIPHTFNNSLPQSKLLNCIENYYKNIPMCYIHRRHFNDTEAMEMFNELCSPKSESIRHIIVKKYFALAATNALLKYFKRVLFYNFAKNALKIDYEGRAGTMIIDFETAHRLELLYPLCITKKKKSSLFGILNECITQIGKRMMRSKILQPSCNQVIIELIQECIEELIKNTDLFFNLELLLKKYVFIDKLIKLAIITLDDDKLKCNEIMLSQILLLKSSLDNIDALHQILLTTTSKVFQDIRGTLENEKYKNVLNEINKVIRIDINNCKGNGLFFQRIYAVQNGISEFLDMTRNIYSNLVEEFRVIVDKLKDELKLPFIMQHSKLRGFHIQLTMIKNHQLPELPDFIEIIHKKGYLLLLTTPPLNILNLRIKHIVDEIHVISNSIICNLLNRIRCDIDIIYNLTEQIMDLDIVFAFAKVSMGNGYCCPTFGDEIRVQDAIHPLLEHSHKGNVPVPNNILGTPEYNFFIITGPNMGGKTVYIKTIALIQIMGQLGCFVPAKKAQLRIFDKLFSRIGFDDNIEQNASSFTVEVKEMQYIINNLTANSLIIIDELGRSTNPKEGQLFAWFLCNYLINIKGSKIMKTFNSDDNENNDVNKYSLKNVTAPFIYLTTHYLELTKLSDIYLNVANLNTVAEEKLIDNRLRLDYTHKINQGYTPLLAYGLALARLIRFPKSIIPRAEELLLANSENNLNITITSTSKSSITTFNNIDTILYDLYSNISIIFKQNDNCDKMKSNLIFTLKKFLSSQTSEFIDLIKNSEFKDLSSILAANTKDDINDNIIPNNITGNSYSSIANDKREINTLSSEIHMNVSSIVTSIATSNTNVNNTEQTILGFLPIASSTPNC